MEKRTNKNVKGITLIALVLTIIVMLILAGITINLTLGEDGIIKRAQEAGQTYKNAEANEIADITSFEASVIPGKVAKTVDGVQYVGDGMGNLIPVPVGFSYLEGTKSTGFVIKNDTDGNEFVWVPCTLDGDNGSIKYDRYAFLTGYVEEIDEETNFKKIKYSNEDEEYWIEELQEDEKKCVAQYEGYYIGRYEAANEENSKLVVQKNKNVYHSILYADAKNKAESLYNKQENNVISKLCSGYAWDTALKFIETKYPEYPTNSVGGNYGNDKITDGNYNVKTGLDKVHPCNIYDMGGNVNEWTTEKYIGNANNFTLSRRGGDRSDKADVGPAASRLTPTGEHVYGYTGFRVCLFL